MQPTREALHVGIEPGRLRNDGPGVRRLPSQELKEDEPQRIDVGAVVELCRPSHRSGDI